MSVALREESAEAQEVSLPPRAISPHPNFVTQSGLRGLQHALAESQPALKAAQAIADANGRRRALELAARDVRYFAERVASAVPQPEPPDPTAVARESAWNKGSDSNLMNSRRRFGSDSGSGSGRWRRAPAR
jgi:hypothetical protein